jgi:putative inorganic carbon (hco3(-)) transporter
MTNSFTRRYLLIFGGLLISILVGIGILILPKSWITILFGSGALLFLIIRPREGLLFLFVPLYFPLLPNVPFGGLEFSVTTLMVVGLFLGTLILQQQNNSFRLSKWQGLLVGILGIAFTLSLLFSDSPKDSLLGYPNLVIYCLLLYIIMALVRSTRQLWSMARVILVLGFILSIWRVELRPLRLIFGLPSLGINGAVFDYHPAVAIALILSIFLSIKEISRFWKIFAWVTLFSLLYHGILYQTRAGWIAWIAMVIIIGLQARGWARAAFAIVLAGLTIVGLLFFPNQIESNLSQTQVTLQAAMGDTSYSTVNPDDLIRLLARDAGLRMFYERPIFGWGPNSYVRLKPSFVMSSNKAANLPGAFNSWLIALVEWGIVGTAVVIFIFLLPIFLSWRAIHLKRNQTTFLALAFAVGAVGIAIHLLFIDLFYSFAWVHAAIALAAARLVLEKPVNQESM